MDSSARTNGGRTCREAFAPVDALEANVAYVEGVAAGSLAGTAGSHRSGVRSDNRFGFVTPAAKSSRRKYLAGRDRSLQNRAGVPYRGRETLVFRPLARQAVRIVASTHWQRGALRSKEGSASERKTPLHDELSPDQVGQLKPAVVQFVRPPASTWGIHRVLVGPAHQRTSVPIILGHF